MNRRNFLFGAGVTIGSAVICDAAMAFAYGLRASEMGLRPGGVDNQGRLLQSILEKAALTNSPVFLEPGVYRVADVTLPKNTRLFGVKGATQLEYAGGSHFIYAEDAKTIQLEGLRFDGRLRPVKEYADGAVRISGAKDLTFRDCHISNASTYGLFVERSTGYIFNNMIENALGFGGLFAHANMGLTISDNLVQDCANNGIMIYRWDRGEDNTIVSGNRVRRIAAVKGGTGPHGNGINSYQCDGVIINDNHVSDCAFSTIRSNSCSNIQIANNTCLRAGETSIYSEFAFQGANISGNIVDGAARGISIANLDHGGRLSVCANNLVRNIHENVPYDPEGHIFGAGILAEADIAITGNVIENTKRFGMLLGWGPYLKNLSASGNVINKTGAGFYVSVVDGIGAVSIKDNIITDAKRGGIIGHRWRDAVTGDMVKEGAKRFPTLDITGNTVNT